MKRSRGFTFLEIVLSIGILAVIMGVSYGALSQILRAKKTLDDTRDVKAIADSVIQRISRELQLASRAGGTILTNPANKGPIFPGRVRGESKKGGDGTFQDSITFLAQEAGQYVPDGATHTGIVQIQYRVEKDPDNPQSDTFVLVRDEMPYIRPPDAAFKKKMTFPITKSLVSLQFRYYSDSDQSWSDSWGQPPHTQLPNLVRFTIKIRSPLGIISTYETSIFIPAAVK